MHRHRLHRYYVYNIQLECCRVIYVEHASCMTVVVNIMNGVEREAFKLLDSLTTKGAGNSTADQLKVALED